MPKKNTTQTESAGPDNKMNYNISDLRWCATKSDVTQLPGLPLGISSPEWLPSPDGTGLLMPESDHVEALSA